MDDTEFELPDAYEMCCGRRKCPEIRLAPDGGALLSVPEEEAERWHFKGDSTEEAERVGIALNKDQATELKKWLESKGF